MLAILALGLFLAAITGTLHALRRLAPGAIDENTVVTIASIGFVTVVLGSLLLLDRRKNRAFERQAIEHRRSWIERDTTPPS